MSGHDRGTTQQLFLDLIRGGQSGDDRTVITVLWFWCCLGSATIIGGAVFSHGIKNSSHRFTSYWCFVFCALFFVLGFAKNKGPSTKYFLIRVTRGFSRVPQLGASG